MPDPLCAFCWRGRDGASGGNGLWLLCGHLQTTPPFYHYEPAKVHWPGVNILGSWLCAFCSSTCADHAASFLWPQGNSFFCDIPLVTQLACMDTYYLDVYINIDCGAIAVTCFVLLLISYTYVIHTIRQCSKYGASKALSTCSARITVVMLCFVPCIIIYVWPLNITWLDKFLAVFYCVFAPLFNPAIYWETKRWKMLWKDSEATMWVPREMLNVHKPDYECFKFTINFHL